MQLIRPYPLATPIRESSLTDFDIPHLDGADVSTPHPDANRRRARLTGSAASRGEPTTHPTDHTLLLSSTTVSASKSSSHTWGSPSRLRRRGSETTRRLLRRSSTARSGHHRGQDPSRARLVSSPARTCKRNSATEATQLTGG